MSLYDEVFALIRNANNFDAQIYGTSFKICRPCGSGEQTIDTRLYRAELTTKGMEPNLPEVDYYMIKGPVNDLLPGDVLIDPTGQSPSMTLMTNLRNKDAVAIRTDRKCTLFNSILDEEPIFQNLRYEWGKRGNFIAGGDLPSAITGNPGRKVVFFGYPNLLPQNIQVQGLKLLETDGTLDPPRRWIIKFVEYTRPVMVAHLEEER